MGGGAMDSPSATFASPAAGHKTINVLVTGFGPFPTKDDQNTSHLVSKLLPSHLTLDLPRNTSSETESVIVRARAHYDKVNVHILNPTAEKSQKGIPVEYAAVRSYVAELYDRHAGTIAKQLRKPVSPPASERDARIGDKSIEKDLPSTKKADLIVHLGMADGWDFISVERGAYKQGFSSGWWGPLESMMGYYMIPDNVGQTILNSGPCPWLTTPMGLQTSFDVDELVDKANLRLHDDRNSIFLTNTGNPGPVYLPIKAHAEAGSYCCGFIYYESLAHCWIRGRDPNVLFCHVPGYTDDASLLSGRDAVVAVIKEAVTQLVARK